MTAKKNASIHDGLERATVVRNETLPDPSEGFGRIYFGHEFCDRLIPSRREMESLLEAASQHGFQATFLTPVCTDAGLKKLKTLIKKLPKNCEITVNDWGVFHFCLESGLIPNVGRVLIPCLRDPRFMTTPPPEDELFAQYIRSCSLNSDVFQEFLVQNNIQRIEIDNTSQFYNFRPLGDFHISLHTPFVYSTTTRRCLYAHAFAKKKPEVLSVSPCKRECLHAKLSYVCPDLSIEMFVSGNTQFYRNETLPKKNTLKEFHIDRIIVSRDVYG